MRLELHSKHAITPLPISFMMLCPVETVLMHEERRTLHSWQAHFATMRTRLKSEANLRVVTGWNILCHVRLCEVPRLRSLPPATRQHTIKPTDTFYRLDSWDNVRTTDFYKCENKNALYENVTKYNRQTLAEVNCNQNMTGNVRITYQWGAFVQPLWQCKDNKYYIFWGCVRSLWYPACNGLSDSTIFFLPHYLINGTIFETKLLNIKCAFILHSYNRASTISITLLSN